jgi:mRNA interferase MazF
MNSTVHLSSTGDIWLARLDPVEGREQAGTRPVLIVSGTRFNRMQPNLRIIVPLTTRDRGLPFHVRLDPPVGGVRDVSFVLSDQPRTIATSRLVSRWGAVEHHLLADVRQWLGDFMEIG